jgi:hypothetical protein
VARRPEPYYFVYLGQDRPRHPNFAGRAHRRPAFSLRSMPLGVGCFASRGSWVRVPSSPPTTPQVSHYEQRGGLDPLTWRARFVPLASSAASAEGSLAAAWTSSLNVTLPFSPLSCCGMRSYPRCHSSNLGIWPLETWSGSAALSASPSHNGMTCGIEHEVVKIVLADSVQGELVLVKMHQHGDQRCSSTGRCRA